MTNTKAGSEVASIYNRWLKITGDVRAAASLACAEVATKALSNVAPTLGTGTEPAPSVPTGTPKLMTVKEAAAYSGLSGKMIYKLVGSGDLEHLRAGRAIRIKPADLDHYLQSRRAKEPTGAEGAWQRLAS